ncbi:hypothetical protein BDW62DRAFT_175464 [Aspergillus aurantiobrunneus]
MDIFFVCGLLFPLGAGLRIRYIGRHDKELSEAERYISPQDSRLSTGTILVYRVLVARSCRHTGSILKILWVAHACEAG